MAVTPMKENPMKEKQGEEGEGEDLAKYIVYDTEFTTLVDKHGKAAQKVVFALSHKRSFVKHAQE